MKRRRLPHPMTRLATALRVAALRINEPTFRKIAVDTVKTIPVCNAEIGGGRRGEMARLGRKTLLRLQEITPDQFEDAASVMRACADAVMSRFEETSVVILGERRHKRRA